MAYTGGLQASTVPWGSIVITYMWTVWTQRVQGYSHIAGLVRITPAGFLIHWSLNSGTWQLLITLLLTVAQLLWLLLCTWFEVVIIYSYSIVRVTPYYLILVEHSTLFFNTNNRDLHWHICTYSCNACTTFISLQATSTSHQGTYRHFLDLGLSKLPVSIGRLHVYSYVIMIWVSNSHHWLCLTHVWANDIDWLFPFPWQISPGIGTPPPSRARVTRKYTSTVSTLLALAIGT